MKGQTHSGMPRAAKTRLAIRYFGCQMCISCGLAFLCVHFETWVLSVTVASMRLESMLTFLFPMLGICGLHSEDAHH